MTYNGYTNYQTWCVSLWLMNEPAGEQYVIDTVAACGGSTHQLATALKEYIMDMAWDTMSENASMMNDLLGHAIEEVDFHELAELYLEDYWLEEGIEVDDDT